MVAPVGMAQQACDRMNLSCQPFAGGNIIAVFQRGFGSFPVLLRDRPRRKFNRMLSFARIGHVKHVAQLGLAAGGIHQRDALGAAADIAPHLRIPEVVLRAGGRVRALGIDHELFVIGIFVQSGGGFEEVRPFVMAVGNSPGGIIRQLKIWLHRPILCRSISETCWRGLSIPMYIRSSRAAFFITSSNSFIRLLMGMAVWGGCGIRCCSTDGSLFLRGYRWKRSSVNAKVNTMKRSAPQIKLPTRHRLSSSFSGRSLIHWF